MMSCSEFARLCSEEHDRPLDLRERLSLRVHLAMCRGCSNFRKQLGFLRSATRRCREGLREPEGD